MTRKFCLGISFFLFLYFSPTQAQNDLVLRILSENQDIHVAAIKELAKKSSVSQKELVAHFLPLLQSSKDAYRKKGLCALAHIGPEAQEALPSIIIALKDPNDKVRQNAAWALGEIGTAAQPAVSSLLELLEDSNVEVQYQTIWALGLIKNTNATQALIQKLNRPHEKLNYRAAWSLGKLKAKEAIPELIMALQREDDEFVRQNAAEALGNIGSTQKEIFQALLKSLRDEDADVRKSAAWALGELGDPKMVPALSRLINDKEEKVRQQAYQSLKKIEIDNQKDL